MFSVQVVWFVYLFSLFYTTSFCSLMFFTLGRKNDENLAGEIEGFIKTKRAIWQTLDWNDISMWLGRLVPELIQLYLTDLYVRDVEASRRCGEHSEVRGQGTCPRPRNQAKAGLHPFHAFYPAWRPRWSVLYGIFRY